MKTRTRRDRGDDGFTLVEMSVAMVILAIVFAAMGAFLITSVAAQYNNELRAKAVQIGNQAIEDGRALPWDLLGFYADDAAAASCGTSGGAVVSIALPTAPAVKSPRVPTAGPKTVTVNGTSYTSTTCYRWIDDDNDGVGAADTNGVQDVKRIEVSISWSERGTTRTHEVQAMRAPTSSEVAPRSATGAPAFGILSVTPDPATSNSAGIDASGGLSAPLTFAATTSSGVSTVQLRWTAADGTSQTRTLTPGANSTSWSVTLPTGQGPFAAVLTTFTITAFSATGETSNQDTKISFSSTPGTLNIATLTATPDSIDVNGTGFSATAFTLTATTNDDATSAVARYLNRSGSQVTVSMVAETSRKFTYLFPAGSGPFKADATAFSVSVTGIGGTATSSTTVTFVPPAVIPVALVSATVDPVLCVGGNRRPARTSVVTVTADGIGASDTVILQLNDIDATRVRAAYTSATASGGVYKFEIKEYVTTADGASKRLDWANNETQLSMSVTATRSSDRTQATQLYKSAIVVQTGGVQC